MGKTTNRIGWIDSLRFLSCMLVALCHLAAQFSFSWYEWFIDAISPPFIRLTGMWATAVFSILIGYFAAMKGDKAGSFAEYTIKRYFQFCIGIGITETLFIVFKYISMLMRNAPFTFESVTQPILSGLWVVFMFEGEPGALSTMPSLFVGSLIAYLLSRTKAGYRWIIGFYAIGIIPSLYGRLAWRQLGYIMLGVLLYSLMKNNKLKWKHPILQILFLVLACVCSYGKVEIVWLIGFSAFFFMLLCFTNTWVQKGLSARWMAKLGEISFYIYLIHGPIHGSIGSHVYELLAFLPKTVQEVTLMMVCIVLDILGAFIAKNIADRIQKLCLKTLQLHQKKEIT